MARVPDRRCADCGRLGWSGTTSLPEGQYRCRPCRAERRRQGNPCGQCGTPCRARYCSSRCSALATSKRIRSDDDTRVRRRQRVALAPGLTEYRIRKLVQRWVRQRRRCTYCPDLATTADHVLPLVRGGTNYEGNLTPCCKPCNSRKAGLTVVEWRTGLRLPRMTSTLAA